MTCRAELHAMLDEILDKQLAQPIDAPADVAAARDAELVAALFDLCWKAAPGEMTRTVNRVMNGNDDPILSEPEPGQNGARAARLWRLGSRLLAVPGGPSAAVVEAELRALIEPGKRGARPIAEELRKRDVLAVYRAFGVDADCSTVADSQAGCSTIAEAVRKFGPDMAGTSDPDGPSWKRYVGKTTKAERDHAWQEGKAARGDVVLETQILNYRSASVAAKRRSADPAAWEAQRAGEYAEQAKAEMLGAPEDPAPAPPPNWD